MKDKINVAELLLHCPKGMELDCTMYDNCTFERIEDVGYIDILVKTPSGIIRLTKEGCYIRHDDYAKCVIFPKGKTTWEGFVPPCQFKDGDIAVSDRGDIHLLRTKDSSYCVYRERWEGLSKFDETPTTSVRVVRLATEEEKQKFFQAIKDNGYKWNAETKDLEELIQPKFKVDDKIKLKGGDEFGIITQVSDCFYTIKCKNNTHCWPIKKQDDWELINEPKFKVGDRIRRKNGNEEYIIISINDCTYYYRLNGHCTGSLGIQLQDEYELVPNKFDINTLVAFDSRVLIRDTKSQKWSPAIWGFYDSDHQDYQYKLIGVIARYCIPYEGNEHLLGKTDDCDEYFKTWK